MIVSDAKLVMLRTHVAALSNGHRASGLHLESGPGAGKSDGTVQYAELLARTINQPVGLVTFMLATISSVDVRGFMIPQKGANGGLDTVFSTPPWYPVKANTAVVEPDGTWHQPGTWQGEVPSVGVLFLDEFSQSDDEVKKPAAELVYKGAVGNTRLPPHWRVISAGNRLTDRSGVMRELMFIVNRRCKLTIDATCPAWLVWAGALPEDQRPHFLTMSFAQKNPSIVFKDTVPDGSDPFCTPRTLCLLDKDLAALRSPEDIRADRLPTDPLAREVAAGWIGVGSAAQFFTHLKFADELPDIADIERDPSKAKLPENKDAQMVCGHMLAHNINTKNASNMVKYMSRLYIDFQCLAVRQVMQQQDRALAITANPDFTNWLVKNKDLLIASGG